MRRSRPSTELPLSEAPISDRGRVEGLRGKKISVAVAGACGRMGSRIVELVLSEPGLSLSAAIEHPKHPRIGSEITSRRVAQKTRVSSAKLAPPLAGSRVLVTSSLDRKVDLLVDFSHPDAVPERVREATRWKCALLVGTTGLSSETRRLVLEAAKKIPCCVAANLSVGMNVLCSVAAETARRLGAAYDVEIFEAHHRGKKDAPSGSAQRLLEILSRARGGPKGPVVHGRHGTDCTRQAGEIGVHSLRAGAIVGVHTVLFAGRGETIEITHRAETRDTFAHGALRAIEFLASAKPGFYSAEQALGVEFSL